MTGRTIIGLGLVALTATAGLAGFAGACDREARREAMKEAAQTSFAHADADGSGSLSLAEFTTFHELMRAAIATQRFQRADADGDGAVTLDELSAARGRRHGRGRGL